MSVEATKFRGLWTPTVKNPTPHHYTLPPKQPEKHNQQQQLSIDLTKDVQQTPTTSSPQDKHVKLTPSQSPHSTIIIKKGERKQGNTGVNSNYSPLHRAAYECDYNKIVALLARKYRKFVNVGENLSLYSPLHLIAESVTEDIVYKAGMALLEAGADPKLLNKQGYDVLYCTARGGCIPLARVLIEKYGLEVNRMGTTGHSPLSVAAEKGQLNMVKFLLEKGANMYNTGGNNPQARLPLHQAATGGAIEVVQFFLNLGFPVDFEQPVKSCCPLILASEAGHANIVELLLQWGADPNKRRSDTVFPLFMAAQNGHLDVIKALKRGGAFVDLYHGNNITNTAYEMARQKEFYEIMKELKTNDWKRSGTKSRLSKIYGRLKNDRKY